MKLTTPAGVDKGACYWCGSRPDSVEHFFPNWLANDQIEWPDGQVRDGRLRLWMHQDFGWNARFVDKVGTRDSGAKGICSGCNNGWMSALESEAKPLLLPMMNGRLTRLTENRQMTLARWAVMKSLVGDADPRAKESGIASRQTRDAIRNGSMPIEVVVRVAAQNQVANFAHHRPLGVGQTRSGATVHVWLSTIIFGHLVLQVYGRTGSDKGSTFEAAHGGISLPHSFTIWPGINEPITWPPQTVLTATEALRFGDDIFPAYFESEGIPEPPREQQCPSCGGNCEPTTRALPVLPPPS